MNSFIDEIRLPKILNLPKEATFGVEIEFENATLDDIEEKMNRAKNNNLLNGDWKLKQEDSLYSSRHFDGFGGEIISPILTDQIDVYKQIRNACHIIKSSNGVITNRCGGHIHIGSKLLDDNINNYLRLARLWTVFEKEIERFGFGEDDVPRDNMSFYASSTANLLKHIELLESGRFVKCNFNNFIRSYGIEKKLALSFFYLNEDKKFHTLEIRCPNGTINPIIWKNNINFFVKFFAACKDNKKDWNLIERMFQEEKNVTFDNCNSENDIDKAYLLAKFIFNNEVDIDNFMLQYKKDSNKVLVKSI